MIKKHKTKWQLQLEKEIRSFNYSLRKKANKNKKRPKKIFSFNDVDSYIKKQEEEMYNNFKNTLC